MSEENYMDQFNTPEEFIRHQILRGSHFSSLTKKMMLKMIRDNNIEFELDKSLTYIKKEVLLETLLTKVSYKELSEYVEVSRKSFCLKFGISTEEFKILETEGLVHKISEHKAIRGVGDSGAKWSQWSGYDVYDYFELTKEEVDNAIKKDK